MNDKEKLLIQSIQKDPFISQNELADRTNLSRSAVAGYISSLIKEGKILGRAYILPEKKGIVCIGGANVDRKIQTTKEVILGTSNPAKTNHSAGGVARNVGETLGRLGQYVSLLSLIGDDHEGKWLLEKTDAFVNTAPTRIVPNAKTGTYSAVLNAKGDLVVALADMNIYDLADQDFIEKRWGYVHGSDMVLLDTNYPKHILTYIIERCKEEKIPLSLVTVSAPKVVNIPERLVGVTWFLCNREEAEAMFSFKLENESDYFNAAERIIKLGAEKVVITRGDKGVIYLTKDGEAGVLISPKVEVKEVTGAGDALVSGIIYGHVEGLRTEDACKVGMACSFLSLQSVDTVSTLINKEKLQETYQTYF